MLVDGQCKRKSAGFIRTSSIKVPSRHLKREHKNEAEGSHCEQEEIDCKFSDEKYRKLYNDKPPLPNRLASQPKLETGRQMVNKYSRQKSQDSKLVVRNSQRHTTPQANKSDPLHQFNEVQQSNYQDIWGRMIGIQETGQQIDQIIVLAKRKAKIQRELAEINQICHQLDERNSMGEQSAKLGHFQGSGSLRNEAIVSAYSTEMQYVFNQYESHQPFCIQSAQSKLNCLKHEYQFEQHLLSSDSQLKSDKLQPEYELNLIPFSQNEDQIKLKHELAKKKFIEQYQGTQIEQQPNDAPTFKLSSKSYQTANKNNEIENWESEERLDSQSSDQEKLIESYSKDDFNVKTIKECMSHGSDPQSQAKEKVGCYQTKGGICFNLDVKEFIDTEPQAPLKTHPKKSKKVNTKQEILKRRYTAKNYDKQARTRVFGH